ncbi:ABC transporter ATP-binding protein [Psychrobacillus sp. BM2]|uniref:ABC transporter ATP-binding protein n=1 Tax=Psychrobacillus sp. BM2 TaxID=3400421 RepID=UPI003B025060
MSLVIKQLKKRYGNLQVLNGVNFEVKQGEIFAILGRNGAGKTTLINALMQLTDYEGEIVYDFNKKNLYKNINLQLQTSQFEEGAKVLETCKLYKALLRSDVNLDNLLDELELSNFKNNYIKTLSGGQKQKLSIVLTLIGQPKIIIFDELTTGLDTIARRGIWDLLKKINKINHTTIILTSHFLDEVEYLADRVMILDNGIAIKIDTVNNIIDNLFESKKKIQFKISDIDRGNNTFSFQFWLLRDNLFETECTKVEENAVLSEIIKNNGFDINMKSFLFEDAFLKIMGYKLTNEGEVER